MGHIAPTRIHSWNCDLNIGILNMRMLLLFVLAAVLAVAALGTQGCGDSREFETPSAITPTQQEVATPPTAAALPTATPQQTLVAEEVVKPLNPNEDCPQAGPTPGAVGAQRSSATTGAESGVGGAEVSGPLDAVVQVNQYRPGEGSERTHVASGVVLEEASYVATVLDFSQPLGCPEVVLRNGNVLPARVIALHQMSGAAILEVSGDGIPQGVSKSAKVVRSETAVRIYSSSPDGSLTALDGAATVAGSETLWILARGPGPAFGDPIFDTEAGFVGMVVHGDEGKGALPDLRPGGAPKPRPYTGLRAPRVAMSAAALMQLSQGETEDDLLNTPVVVRFFGITSLIRSPIGGDPVAIGEKVAGYLRELDRPVDIGGFGGSLRSIFKGMREPYPTFNLELLYPISQPLETSDGTLLGVARYFVLLWDRGAGQPDLILAGSSPDLITHAFEADGIDELWSHVQAARLTSYAPFRTSDSAGFPDEYPLKWSLTTDRETYSTGETVRLGLRIENVSPLRMEVQLPSPFRVYLANGSSGWDSEFVSDREFEAVPSGEVLLLNADWDQTDNQGEQVPAGTYHISESSYHADSGAYATGTSFEIVE